MNDLLDPWRASAVDGAPEHLVRAYALVCHAEMAAGDQDSVVGAALALQCLQIQGALRDAGAPLDPDLLTVTPPGTAVELLRQADQELGTIPDAAHQPALLTARALLVDAVAAGS